MYQSAATYVAQKKSRLYGAILQRYAQGMEKPAQGGQGGQSGKRKAPLATGLVCYIIGVIASMIRIASTFIIFSIFIRAPHIAHRSTNTAQ